MYNNLQQNGNNNGNNYGIGYNQMPQKNNKTGNNNFQSVMGQSMGNMPQQSQPKSLPNDALWEKMKAQPIPKDPPKPEVVWVSGTNHLYRKKKQPETDHIDFTPPKPQQHPQYTQQINPQQYLNQNQQQAQWNNNNNNQQQPQQQQQQQQQYNQYQNNMNYNQYNNNNNQMQQSNQYNHYQQNNQYNQYSQQQQQSGQYNQQQSGQNQYNQQQYQNISPLAVYQSVVMGNDQLKLQQTK